MRNSLPGQSNQGLATLHPALRGDAFLLDLGPDPTPGAPGRIGAALLRPAGDAAACARHADYEGAYGVQAAPSRPLSLVVHSPIIFRSRRPRDSSLEYRRAYQCRRPVGAKFSLR